MTFSGGRRALLRHGVSATAGAFAGAAAVKAVDAIQANGPLPFYEGPAASIHADRRTPPKHAQVDTVWSVDTERKLVALTFDDGPMPNWTPKVLESLKRQGIPATFFVVGRNLAANKDIFRGYEGQHELANHTWEHKDLARQDLAEATDAIERAHDEITKATGKAPTLLRPPYGHLAGSTMLTAAEFGYTVVLWSRQMLESDYRDDPPGLVEYISAATAPGDIILAHDTGPADRLVAIDNLDAMISGLKNRGFEFVTVTDLLAARHA